MKNFIKIIAIFSLIIFLIENVNARPISLDRARQVGSKFINNNTSIRTTANDLDGWSGTLTSLDNTQMYLTLMDQELTLTLYGKRVNVAQTPITLNPGWTWIAYLNAEPISIEEAFAGIELSDGDLIKSQNQYSLYSSEDGWTGTLTTLQPGQGYIFLNNSQNVIILIYPER